MHHQSSITWAHGIILFQIRAWKEWEKEAAGQDYEFSNGKWLYIG
jgi:hypothetical protein